MEANVAPFKIALMDAQGRPMGGEHRGVGLHLSDVIRYRRITLGELSEEQLSMGEEWAQYGFIFEMWVGKALATYLSFSDANLVSPGECEVDGIFINPDLLDVEEAVVVETKATWKQLKKLIDPTTNEVNVEGLHKYFWHWLVQVMAQCKALGTTKARLIVHFVNGDYSFRPPFGGPKFYVINLKFSRKEIEDNWAGILRDAADMREKGIQ